MSSSSESPEGHPPSPSAKVYHPKRPHKKTRTGCKNCKARKVKCDEVRPSCHSCAVRSIPCIYEVPKSAVVAKQRHVQKPPSPAPTPSDGSQVLVVSEPLFLPSSAVDATDMKLLWFYTTESHTSFSVAGRHRQLSEAIMQNQVPQHAFKNPFLMDTLLALSSMHLQKLNQPVDQNRALAYRVRSYEGYRKAIECARPDTYAALMATSLILTALSAQNFRDPNTPDLYIIDWMLVWRGISLMVNMVTLPEVLNSGMGGLFYRPPMDMSLASQHIPTELLFMLAAIQPDDPDYGVREHYLTTMRYIGALYQHLQDGLTPLMRLRIIVWFTFLPPRFYDLARERRPRALVIIAQYAAFLKLTNRVWWMDGVGQRSLTDLIAHLSSSEWDEYLGMPCRAALVEDEQEVGRAILNDSSWDLNMVVPELGALNLFDEPDLTYVDHAGQQVGLEDDGKVVVQSPEGSGGSPMWH